MISNAYMGFCLMGPIAANKKKYEIFGYGLDKPAQGHLHGIEAM
jgi:hypothetical protein